MKLSWVFSSKSLIFFTQFGDVRQFKYFKRTTFFTYKVSRVECVQSVILLTDIVVLESSPGKWLRSKMS